jgi:flagella basal body P-ring formation protein FlgA
MKEQVATARQQAQQQQEQAALRERAQRYDQTYDVLVQERPELAEEAKFQEFANANIGHLRTVGFTDAEIASSLDHRVFSLADDARQWRAHKAAQASLPPKKVVQKSAVKPLTTDGQGSRATTRARPPSNATRDRKVDWAVTQMLNQE